MESSSIIDDLSYPPASHLRRGRPDTLAAYNQESDCPLHYRRHHPWGEQKQKHHRRIPRHICRRSSHTDILRAPRQLPHHNRDPHLQSQQYQQNNSNSVLTTNTIDTTTSNNNNNRKNETISSHSVKCLQQTHEQAVTTDRRSEAPSFTVQRSLIRVGGSDLEHWIPFQCQTANHPEFIYREYPLNLTKPRLAISRLRRQHSYPGADRHQRQREIRSCNEFPIYSRLSPQRRTDIKQNLCIDKQSKLKDENLTPGACPLDRQSQLSCDCQRGGWDALQGRYLPGSINLEKSKVRTLETIQTKDEDKEILDADFVMDGRETPVIPIIRDQPVLRPGHTKRKYPVLDRDREIRRTIEFASSTHELTIPRTGGVFQNINKSNARRTQHEHNNSCTMNRITQEDINDEFETISEQFSINSKGQGEIPVRQNKSPCYDRETQNEEDPEKETNTKIYDIHEPKVTTTRDLRESTHETTETKSIYKTKNNLYTNNALLSLGRFVTGYNIRVFFFVLFVGCVLQCSTPGTGRCCTSWLLPGADAKAVVSLSKNVLMTDADNQQVSSLGKIDPPSDSTKEDRTFNDFPDVDTDSSDVSESISDAPGSKGYVGDKSSSSTNTNDDDPSSEKQENLDEYEAYDDSTGEDSKVRNDVYSKIENPGKDSEPTSDTQYSDESDREIANSIEEDENDYEEEDEEDEDDDGDEEDWAGDMSYQPLFVPPGMNMDRGQAGVGATGKHSTEQETTPKLEEPPRVIPEYMLKLYQKFTQKHYIHPASDTVRSFSNINDDILFNISNGNELPGARTRNHTLIFNISSFPRGEQINLAHLRLYKLVERDRNKYVGDDRKVSLYEVIPEDDGTRHLKLVSQKHIYGRNSGWESFDVTPAVRRWVAEIENGVVQMLEVTIESIFNSVWGNDVDISTEPRNKKEPLLIVFSKQINKRLVHQHERDELLQHDMTLSDIEDVDNFTTTEPPVSSEATDGGEEDDDNDDEEDEDSSREDSYGSIGEMTSYARVTQSMRTGKEYLSRPKQKIRVKRSRTSSKRNICRRTKLEVDFKDIQGHDWIVAPKKYQAFECSGKCYFPLGDHLRPTKHAIIRANLHIHNKKVTRPCCVPTKLDSISLLYLDSKTNGYTFKYKFEGMKVVECGCR